MISQSFDEISPHTRFDDLKSLKQKSYCGGMIIWPWPQCQGQLLIGKFKNYIFAFVLTVIFAVSLLLLLLLVLSRFGPRNIMVILNRPIRLFHWRDVISSASWQHITIGWACLRVNGELSLVASMSTTITKS